MWAIGIGLILAIIDMVVMSTTKAIHTGLLPHLFAFPAMLLYSITPYIFMRALKYSSMTVMNVTWDLSSDILVTAVGLLYFRETLSHFEVLGLIFGFISIGFFTIGGS